MALALTYDDEASEYGREALAAGLWVWATTPLMIAFGQASVPAGWGPPVHYFIEREALFTDPATRAVLYSKLARSINYHLGVIRTNETLWAASRSGQ